MQGLHLQELPYYGEFEHGAGPARNDHESVRGQYEMVQLREKRFVLERLLHERIDFLFER